MGWSLLLLLITKFLLEKPVKFQLIQGFYGPVHDKVIPFMSETINRISLLAVGLDFSWCIKSYGIYRKEQLSKKETSWQCELFIGYVKFEVAQISVITTKKSFCNTSLCRFSDIILSWWPTSILYLGYWEGRERRDFVMPVLWYITEKMWAHAESKKDIGGFTTM